MDHVRPDAVSGTNDGGDIEVRAFISWALAEVIEAALLGHCAIMTSHCCPFELPLPWKSIACTASALFEHLIAKLPPHGLFLNVKPSDLRHVRVSEDVVKCSIDPRPLDVVYEETGSGLLFRRDYHSRKRMSGHDVEVCVPEGRVTITRFTLVE